MTHTERSAPGLWVVMWAAFLAFSGTGNAWAAGDTPMLVLYGTAYNEHDLTLWPSTTDLLVENVSKGLATTAYISQNEQGRYTGVLAVFTGGWAASAGDTIRYSIPESLGVVVNPIHVLSGEEVAASTARADIFIMAPTTSTGGPPALSRLLLRAFPNPVHGEGVRFVFRVPARQGQASGGTVDLLIANAAGGIVARLRGPLATRTEGTVSWDLRDPRGRRAAAGVYFASLRSASAGTTVKFVLLE